jgi:uncharacterized membrane protein YphA (DoxX/SURF4 family)
MKAQNKFKEPIIAKEQKSSYSAATDALIGAAVVFSIAILLTLLSKEIALGFILFCILYTVMLIRFTQQKNN